MRHAGKKALSTGGNMNGSLNWEVLVTPGIPAVTSDLAPGTKQSMWSPISSTLISGKRDAILVDTFITVEQADILVDWVAAKLYPDRVNPGGALWFSARAVKL
jgi:hypothetical protein